MNFLDIVYHKILEINRPRFTLGDIANFTGFKNGFDKNSLSDALKKLEKQGKIRFNHGYYTLTQGTELIKCVIFGTSKDYAFARPVTFSKDKEQDIFISPAGLNGACHMDTVMVQVEIGKKAKKYREKLPAIASGKQEGKVTEILERGFKVAVGIISIDERGVATVVPDDRRFTDSIFIDPNGINGATNNAKVVVDILDYPSNIKMARGVVREVLGDPLDARVTTLSIIRSYNLFENFSDAVLAEAKKVCKPVSDEDLSDRKDYRDRLIFTIDGDDAKDFDDAISLEKSGDTYNLGVYIADVSHYVRAGSELDSEAFIRGTSVYFPDHVLPMLPEELSNGICSLNPNEDRLCLAVEMRVSPSGKVEDYEIHKGVIRSAYRMTYKKVEGILDGDRTLCEKYAPLVNTLKEMNELSKILTGRRNSAGQLDFDIPEAEIILNDNGTVADIHRKPRGKSDRLIEQFMVLTNEVVARNFSKMKVPFVYRVHENPTPERVAKFKAFAGSLGLKFDSTKGDLTPRDFQKLLFSSQGKDYSTALSKVMLRSMQKARYATENLGHFGLALGDYCHFTSPIRRYPDLTIHRIISEIISGKMNSKKLAEFEEFTERSAERSSTTERVAEEAERAVDAQKAAEYMKSKVGEVFAGAVSGVTENGFFVELDNTVEGFVSVSRLPQGKVYFDEAHYLLSVAGHSYRIGDRVEIKVVDANIVTRKVDFELSDYHRTQSTPLEVEKSFVGNKQKNINYTKNQNGKKTQNHAKKHRKTR